MSALLLDRRHCTSLWQHQQRSSRRCHVAKWRMAGCGRAEWLEWLVSKRRWWRHGCPPMDFVPPRPQSSVTHWQNYNANSYWW